MAFKRVLGLDLSLTGTGWARYEDGNKKLGTLAPAKGIIGVERLDWIRSQVHHLANRCDLVVFEALAFSAHDRNLERSGLAWLCRHRLWQYKLPYVTVAPTTLKKFITGSGKGEKNKIMLEIYKRWGVETSNDNEADAYGLMKIGIQLLNLQPHENKAQQDVLATVRKNEDNAAVLMRIGAL